MQHRRRRSSQETSPKRVLDGCRGVGAGERAAEAGEFCGARLRVLAVARVQASREEPCGELGFGEQAAEDRGELRVVGGVGCDRRVGVAADRERGCFDVVTADHDAPRDRVDAPPAGVTVGGPPFDVCRDVLSVEVACVHVQARFVERLDHAVVVLDAAACFVLVDRQDAPYAFEIAYGRGVLVDDVAELSCKLAWRDGPAADLRITAAHWRFPPSSRMSWLLGYWLRCRGLVAGRRCRGSRPRAARRGRRRGCGWRA